MRPTSLVPARLFAWAMALCPFGLAVAFHTGLRPVPLSIPAPARPSLAFDQYAIDLRTIRPTTVQTAYYTFQNRGPEPVKLVKVEPSCGCLTPEIHGLRDSIVEPDARGRIVFKMQPANSTPGPHEYTVNVKYTDPQPRDVQLILKLVIPETILIDPPAAAFFHPHNVVEPTIQDFTITDSRGKAVEITDVSINTDLVQAVIGESSRSAIGHHQQTIRIIVAPQLPPERKQFLLRIRTSDRDIPELRVPIMLEGAAPPAENEADHEGAAPTESAAEQPTDEAAKSTESGE